MRDSPPVIAWIPALVLWGTGGAKNPLDFRRPGRILCCQGRFDVTLHRSCAGDPKSIAFLKDRLVFGHASKVMPLSCNLAGEPMSLAVSIIQIEFWVGMTRNPYGPRGDARGAAGCDEKGRHFFAISDSIVERLHTAFDFLVEPIFDILANPVKNTFHLLPCRLVVIEKLFGKSLDFSVPTFDERTGLQIRPQGAGNLTGSGQRRGLIRRFDPGL